LLKIELGKIIQAIQPSFKSCEVLSINKASISELCSVSFENNSKSSFACSFKFDLKDHTEYGGLERTKSNLAFSFLSSAVYLDNNHLYFFDFSKLSNQSQ